MSLVNLVNSSNPAPKSWPSTNSAASAASRTAFRGIWPALLTPLTAALDIDIPSFTRHAQSLLDAGCTGVTPFGTTGEGPSFSVAERMAAIDGLIAGGIPARRILVSSSAAALPDAITLTRHAVQAGCFGVLLLPPFFLKGVPDQGVIDAYSQVIDAVRDDRLRVVLYHIPQISGVALSHHVISTLVARYPQTIIGIKDSGCQRDWSLGLAKTFMVPKPKAIGSAVQAIGAATTTDTPRLQVWVGNEPDLQVMAAQGSVGAVSGVANVMPRLLQRLVAQFDGPNAPRDLARVKAFIDILGGYGMTAAFKGIMAILTVDAGWRRVRAPLVALTDTEFERLKIQLQNFALDRTLD
jgi:4-hydroxy-tetrahydrodipicolinate synthase